MTNKISCRRNMYFNCCESFVSNHDMATGVEVLSIFPEISIAIFMSLFTQMVSSGVVNQGRVWEDAIVSAFTDLELFPFELKHSAQERRHLEGENFSLFIKGLNITNFRTSSFNNNLFCSIKLHKNIFNKPIKY